ncbi:hypothetical protein DFS34DRAFT_268517 [Phlyctochytrium arcticum]|nr:hypothetical protein DFS34DRAFT_268517 [Phlyctochytrium arcticum]
MMSGEDSGLPGNGTLTPEEELKLCYEDLAQRALEMDGPSLANACIIGGVLSITACTLVLVSFSILRRHYPHLANRVSLRLAIQAITFDLFYAIFILLSALPTDYNDPLCSWTMAIQIVFLLMSLFTTFSISLNLLLVFVLKFKTTPKYERAYNVVCLLLSCTIASLALAFRAFGWDGTECFYYDDPCLGMDYSKALAWQWATYYVWIAFVLAFCTGCGILFYFKATRPMRKLVKESAKMRDMFNDTYLSICQAVDSIKWYCVVPFFSQFFVVLAAVQMFTRGQAEVWIWWAANFSSASQGLFSSIVFFCFDPSAALCRKGLISYIVRKHYLSYFKFDAAFAPNLSGFHITRAGLSFTRISDAGSLAAPGSVSYPSAEEVVTTAQFMDKLHMVRVKVPKHPWLFSFIRRYLLREQHVFDYAAELAGRPKSIDRLNVTSAPPLNGNPDGAVSMISNEFHAQAEKDLAFL